jgi:hypothetical protein
MQLFSRLRHFFTKKSEPVEPRIGPLKLVLHVGPHKTGTTSLQKALLKQYGAETPRTIWYPIPQETGPGHASKAWQLMGRKGHAPSPAIRELVEQSEQYPACHCLILSSESFSALYPNKVASLAEQVSGTELHIVVTLSPLGRRAVSTWQEMVKHRSLVSLEDAREAVINRPGLSPHFVRFFSEHLPQAKLSVVISDAKRPESIYELFGEATGISLATPDKERELVANRSMGVIEVNILRSFNAGAEAASLSTEDYRKGRSLLRNQFNTDQWRAVVPLIPLTLPEEWIGALKERADATIADLRLLQAQGRIAVYGNLESLDDLATQAKQRDEIHLQRKLA